MAKTRSSTVLVSVGLAVAGVIIRGEPVVGRFVTTGLRAAAQLGCSISIGVGVPVGRKAVAVGRVVEVAVGVQVGGHVGRASTVACARVLIGAGAAEIANAWQALKQRLNITKINNRGMMTIVA
jgi:hypothetical protein